MTTSPPNRAALIAEVDDAIHRARVDEVDRWEAELLAKLEAERASRPIHLRSFTMTGAL